MRGPGAHTPRICDRFDLTLECIRRHYAGEDHPLASCLTRNAAFFELFGSFEGYVRFWLLDDLVNADCSAVTSYLPVEDFERSPLPTSPAEYETYAAGVLEFIAAREQRMVRRCASLSNRATGASADACKTVPELQDIHATRARTRALRRRPVSRSCVGVLTAAFAVLLAASPAAHAFTGNAPSQAGEPMRMVIDGGNSVLSGTTYAKSGVVRPDGTIAMWGANSHGQLGNGTTVDSSTPVTVLTGPGTPLTGVIAVSLANGTSSVALRFDGTVWSWGRNGSSNLGNGTTTDSPYAVQALVAAGTPLTGVVSISHGYGHTMAVRDDGTLWGWGENGTGELGNGATADSAYAVQVMADATTPLTGVVATKASDNFSWAVRSDGTVWSWGQNDRGQLANGTTTNSPYPVQAMIDATTPVTDAVRVGGGSTQSSVLAADGTIWTWGYNFSGQLGDGTTTQRLYAVKVKRDAATVFDNVQAIASNGSSAYALTADGKAWAWGWNSSGRLADGTTTNRLYPAPVLTTSGTQLGRIMRLVGAGGNGLAVSANGVTYGWGSNDQMSAGTGTSGPITAARPGFEQNDGGYMNVAAGCSHSLALRYSGQVYAFGANASGQLGDATTSPSRTPRLVVRADGTPLQHVKAVAAGCDFSLALLADGTVWGWGENSLGQLGDGTNVDRSHAVQVQVGAGSALQNVVQVNAGADHAVARLANGTVAAWGLNSSGQLGNGTTASSSWAITVQRDATPSALSRVVNVGAGGNSSTALLVDGSRWSWGSNTRGQLADGTQGSALFPVRARTDATPTWLPGGLDLALGSEHAVGLTVGGGVWSWGRNDLSQIADGTVADSWFAVRSQASVGTPLAALRAIRTGDQHTLGLRTAGTVAAWGSNLTSQLGDGTTTTPTYPVNVRTGAGTDFVGPISVDGGGGHSLALRHDGTVWSWGANASGQVGDCLTTIVRAFAAPLGCDPPIPGSLVQYYADGTTVLPAGAAISATSVRLAFSVRSALDGETITPWIEVSPYATGFVGTCGVAGPNMYQGTPIVATTAGTWYPVAQMQISSLPDGEYRWRACATTGGRISDWRVAGAYPDFYIDTTPPPAPTTVNDGTGADIAWQSSTTTASANWTSVADLSGIQRYEYCISTGPSCGGTALTVGPWVSAASALSMTQGALTLAEGTVYYSSVRAVDMANNAGAIATSDGFRIDASPPPAVTTLAAASPTTAPALTWSTVVDTGSGTAFYRVFRSTTAGVLGTQVSTDAAVTSGTYTDASIMADGTYYYTVQAVDVVGNAQTVGNNQISVSVIGPLYLTSSASAMTGSWLLSSTPGATANTTTTAATSDATGYIHFKAGATNSTFATQPNAPTGQGWFWDAAPNRQYQAGTWRAWLTTDATNSHTGYLVVRAWKVTLSGGAISTYSDLTGGWIQGTTNVGATTSLQTHFVDLPIGAVTFGPSEYLYVEIWERITAGASGAGKNTASVKLRVNTTSERIVTALPTATASLSIAVDANDQAMPLVGPGVDATASTLVTVDGSSSPTGYLLSVTDEHDSWGADTGGGASIPDWTGAGSSPSPWPAGTSGYWGLTVLDATGGRLAKWGAGVGTATAFAGNAYAGIKSSSGTLLHERPNATGAGGDAISVSYRANFSAAQPPATYGATVTYSVVVRP